MTHKNGFTLIEVLIVVGIIGLIGAFSAVAVTSARSRMRDAKRLSDVRQIQSALEDVFKLSNTYPAGEGLRLGDLSASACLSSSGFAAACAADDTVALSYVPVEVTSGVDGLVRCGNPPAVGYCYTALSDGGSYKLGFELEHGIEEAGISAGANCLTPELGIKSGMCL